jgi:DNA-binding transcriptional LysR family regulator
MDRLESMAAFVAVVEQGGFTAASHHLRMPLATISRKVSDLEEHLRVRLLVRGKRQVSPTDSGREYFATARRLLEEVAEAERIAAGEFRTPQGELVVSAPLAFGRLHVAPLVAEFLRAYPDVSVRLMLADRVVSLVEEHVDLALRIGELAESNLVAVRAGMIRTVTCASPGYLAARGEPADPAALRGHDCVTFTHLESAQEWEYRGKPYPVRSRLAVSSGEAAGEAAALGAGITRTLCYQVSEAVAAGRLRLVLRDFEPPPMPVHLVHIGGRLVPLKLRAFIDFMLPRLRPRLVFDEVAA